MSYSNPLFPASPASNVGHMANIAPTAYAPKTCAVPTAHTAAHHYAPAYAAYRDTGVILVLFILLVIISRAWGI